MLSEALSSASTCGKPLIYFLSATCNAIYLQMRCLNHKDSSNLILIFEYHYSHLALVINPTSKQTSTVKVKDYFTFTID